MKKTRQSKSRTGINLPKRIYLQRVFGFILALLPIGARIYQQNEGYAVWISVALICLLWPHIAYLISSRSSEPNKAELRNLVFDCVLGGLFSAVVQFNPLVVVSMWAMLIMDSIAVGGLRLFFKSIAGLIPAALIAGFITGFKTDIDTSLLTVVMCIPILILFPPVNGITAYARTRQVISLKDEIEKQKDEIFNVKQQLESANLTLTSTRDALWGEMQLAKKIQLVLLPERPEINGYQIAAYMQPADDVGGDYYDIINVAGFNWLVIGDVSGHGVPAGLIMMMVQTAIHTALVIRPDFKPQQLLTHINTVITANIKKMNEGKYMTITVLACLKDSKIYFSGLHQDIMLYRSASKSVELVETDGIWLGLVDNAEEMFHDNHFILEDNDVILLFTDGITEAWKHGSVKNERDSEFEMFGDKLLQESFRAHGDLHPEEIKRGILSALENYDFSDDITLLIVKKQS